jgi:hypothetical protein
MKKLKEFFGRFDFNRIDPDSTLNVICLVITILTLAACGLFLVSFTLVFAIKSGNIWLFSLIPIFAIVKVLVSAYRKD